MKAPKYIQEIAKRMTEESAKRFDFVANNPKQWDAHHTKELMVFRDALLKGRVYLGVDSVSKTGMSRVIKICYIKDNKLHGVSSDIYSLAGCDKNRRISGCGMDMLFAAQYNLFRALCPNHRYQDSMPRYNSL